MKKFLAIAALLLSANAVAEQYQYAEIKIGIFVEDWCTGCVEVVEGDIPTYLSLGHAWVHENMLIAVEYQHRSNLDKGWPFSETGELEYTREGFFIRGQYRFNIFSF